MAVKGALWSEKVGAPSQRMAAAKGASSGWTIQSGVAGKVISIQKCLQRWRQ